MISQKLKLHILKAWNQYLKATHGTFKWDDTTIITTETYNAFRVDIYDPDAITRPRHSTLPAITPTNTALSEFKKAQKRDKSHYTVLKDEDNWDDWKRKMMATVDNHNCEDVINPSYAPTSLDEITLFREKNKFMYNVFLTILQTPTGIHYVRQHEKHYMSQYSDNHCIIPLESTTCRLEVSISCLQDVQLRFL